MTHQFSFYADLFHYRELFLNLFRRDLETRYRGSLLGLAWSLVAPAALVGVYTLVFSVLLRAVSVEHYPLFLVSGLLTWVFFQSSVQMSCLSLISSATLVTQVRFPRQLLPFSIVATNLVTFGVMLAVILPINLVIIPATRTTFWAVVPLTIPLVALTAGLSTIVACMNVLFRDIEHLVSVILLPWFFLTPIFYALDSLPAFGGKAWIVELLHWGNPITPVLVSIRDVLFEGQLPSIANVAYACGVGLASLLLAALVFRRVDDRLAAEL